MQLDEGYIKYRPVWKKTAPLRAESLVELNRYRQLACKKGWIGAYADGVSYGNISCRTQGEGLFVITGAGTGHLPALDERHYSLVTEVNVEANTLFCQGPIIASSEAMSHSIFYRYCPHIQGVLHVHHLDLWEKLLASAPKTPSNIAYGTPEMAWAILDILTQQHFPASGILVMEGHREGIFSYGPTLQDAFEEIETAITAIQ